MQDTKQRIKQELNRLVAVMRHGCGRECCYRPYCAANPAYLRPDNLPAKALELILADYQPCTKVCPVSSLQMPELLDPSSDLLLRIQLVFADLQAFNLSFVPGGNPRLLHSQNNGLFDQRAARIVLDLIRSTPEFQERLENGPLQKLRAQLSTLEGQPLSRQRALLLLLYFSGHLQWKIVRLTRLVCVKLGQLSQESLNSVIGWMQAFTQEQFGAVVDRLNEQLGRLIGVVGLQARGEIRHPFRILQKIYRLNERLGRVQISRFYNESISELRTKDLMQLWYFNKLKKWEIELINVLNYPFLMCPTMKACFLYLESQIEARHAQQQTIEQGEVFGEDGQTLIFLICKVSRSTLLDDAMKFVHDTKDFKKPLKVIFAGEKGIDEGGVKKQFFSLASRQLFDTQFGMFQLACQGRFLWFNPCTLDPPVRFELAGILLGLAIYNSINIEINLSPLIYKRLLGQELGLSDLRIHDQQVFNNMKFILEDNTCDFEALGLTFSTTFDNFGERVVVELVEGGAERAVTAQNREEYVPLFVNWVLGKSVQVQFNAFRKGFYKVLTGDMISLFHYSEIEELVQGSALLDFHVLRTNTEYEGYDQHQPVVLWLWEIILAFTELQKRKFLFFCTGSERAPVGGLKNLQFVVQRHGDDSEKLPCASTCFNILLLPNYSTKKRLEQKLLKAIQNAQGFGLA